jgi:hypothetical protein
MLKAQIGVTHWCGLHCRLQEPMEAYGMRLGIVRLYQAQFRHIAVTSRWPDSMIGA